MQTTCLSFLSWSGTENQTSDCIPPGHTYFYYNAHCIVTSFLYVRLFCFCSVHRNDVPGKRSSVFQSVHNKYVCCIYFFKHIKWTEEAIDRCKWRKMIKDDVQWSGWVWVGECFFWYRPTRVVPDQRPLNGCVCVLYLFMTHCCKSKSSYVLVAVCIIVELVSKRNTGRSSESYQVTPKIAIAVQSECHCWCSDF